MVKNAVLMLTPIDMIVVQNLLESFCYVLGKDALWRIPLLDSLCKLPKYASIKSLECFLSIVIPFDCKKRNIEN